MQYLLTVIQLVIKFNFCCLSIVEIADYEN
jgi:hypothetical protein